MAKPFPESGIAIRRSIRCFVFAVVFENTFELLAVAKARCYTSVARQQWKIYLAISPVVPAWLVGIYPVLVRW